MLQCFKRLKENAEAGGRPYREKSVEFMLKGRETSMVFECNPNLYADPFKALVFLKVKNAYLEVSSQAQLTMLSDVVKTFLAQSPE